MIRLALGWLLLAPAWGRGEDPPPVAETWAQRIQRDYAHYQDIEFAFLANAAAGPACPTADHPPPATAAPGDPDPTRARFEADPAAFVAACQALAFESWMLRADLKPVDQRIFSPGWLRIALLPEGIDANQRVRDLVERGALASKAVHIVAPAGRYLVDLHLPCGATGISTYDAADLVKALRTEPAFDVQAVAWSPCGRTSFALREAAELLEAGAEPREYWGLDFPEARDRARSRGGGSREE